jgi:MFS family permease
VPETSELLPSSQLTDEPATRRDPAPPRTRRLPRHLAFWVVAVTTSTLLAASSAPSPLYAVYEEQFGFSAITLTTVFAIYVIALLATLLVFGRLSDHIGRRPLLAAALVVEAASMAVFIGASGTGWLFAARSVQGVATGVAVAVLGAYLLDLQPADGSRLGSLVNSIAPVSGLAIGALGAGLLVQYGPDPEHFVFWLLGAAFLVLAAVVAILPESVTRRPGALASLRPQVSVPRAARAPFARATPVMIASWALGGMILSLGGSLLGVVFGVTNHAEVGLLIALVPTAGALAALVLRDVSAGPMARIGTVALVVGAALVLVSLATSALWLFVIAALVAGAGFGVGFLGALRGITQLAEPHERAGLLSAVYVVSYLGFSIPAVVSGVLVTHLGLLHTALGYSAFVGVVAAVTLVGEVVTRRRAS